MERQPVGVPFFFPQAGVLIMNVLQRFQQTLHQALTGLVGDPTPYAAQVKATGDGRHGDYQANCAMALAKVLGMPPREVAQKIKDRLDLGDWLEAPEIAGPGFLNFRLRSDFLAAQVRCMAADERLGVQLPVKPRSLVIDFSSPNVAKPMHVGHLRSTIIGDALARLFRFLGHEVVTDNHLGDWGTQFGILLYGYKHFLDREAFEKDPVEELARLYIAVRQRMKKVKKNEDDEEEEVAPDDPVAQACRDETAKLHAGDAENLRLWQQFLPSCHAYIARAYKLLHISFDHQLGESFYQPMLAKVVEDLRNKGLAVESQGALVIHSEAGDEKEPPAIVRKRDGAFTYHTTDLATIKYRVEHFHPDTILYVVGTPQAFHFKQLFGIARRWGYDKVDLEHIQFGSVLGDDRRPFKTREGRGEALARLLHEAMDEAIKVYERNCQEMREHGEEVMELGYADKQHLAEVIGVGAVKYADLFQNRTSDYVFSFEKMLAMTGNTGTYMQNAYVRNRAIFRKGNIDPEKLRRQPPAVQLVKAEERQLALQLLRLEDALLAAAADYKPSLITTYLWDLCKAYSSFYTACPVLKAETPELRQSRLLLCDVTARVIQRSLDLLGIQTVEEM
jgi:arginyl-tRNA synthetase